MRAELTLFETATITAAAGACQHFARCPDGHARHRFMLSSRACCSKPATSLYRSRVVSMQSCILVESVSCSPPGLNMPAQQKTRRAVTGGQVGHYV